jgi:hypothetical protein
MLMLEAAACVGEIETGIMNCTPALLPIKRREGRRLVQARRIRKDAGEEHFGGQAFHRKWTVYPQDFNTLDHACFDVTPDGRAVTDRSPQTWTPFGLLSEQLWTSARWSPSSTKRSPI